MDSKVHSTVIEMDSVENLAAEGELHNEGMTSVLLNHFQCIVSQQWHARGLL